MPEAKLIYASILFLGFYIYLFALISHLFVVLKSLIGLFLIFVNYYFRLYFCLILIEVVHFHIVYHLEMFGSLEFSFLIALSTSFELQLLLLVHYLFFICFA